MRRSQAFFISTGMAVAGLLVSACGATHSTTSTSLALTPPAAPAANAAAHPHIAFLSPRAGARVGSTVHVRIRRSEAGRVRFILDGRSDHETGAATTVYRHVRPGLHRLRAELLVASGQGSAAMAVVRFRVKPPHVAAPAAPPPPVTTTTTSAPAPAVTMSATPTITTQTAPPAQTQTTAAPPPPPTGIPQNGGGDDDSDNHGAPSDGDGNL